MATETQFYDAPNQQCVRADGSAPWDERTTMSDTPETDEAPDEEAPEAPETPDEE